MPSATSSIRSLSGELQLLDGRNLAQNGWFIVRTPLATKTTGKVAEWSVEPHTIPSWTRTPVIGFSQVGYHPSQPKRAVIELDANDTPLPTASLIEIRPDGKQVEKMKARVEPWGRYLRYNYVVADFSSVKDPGLYLIQYGTQKTGSFPIAADVYERVWHPTLDVFFPVQMDHMFVNEGYRVWHGAAHLDDAVQAPLERAALRRLPDGRDDQHPVQAGRTDSGPGGGRLVRRGRLRHPGRVARDDGLEPRGDVGDVPAAARPDARSTRASASSTSTGRTGSRTCCSRSSTARCRSRPSTARSAAWCAASSTASCTGTTTSATPRRRPTT